MLTEKELWQSMSIIASVEPPVEHADFLWRAGWWARVLGLDDDAEGYFAEAEKVRAYAEERRAEILESSPSNEFEGLRGLITTGIEQLGD